MADADLESLFRRAAGDPDELVRLLVAGEALTARRERGPLARPWAGVPRPPGTARRRDPKREEQGG